jgi:carbonic anhydrase
MAINLSRSFAKPCDILCDLTIDDVAISQATVTKSGDTIVATFQDQKPSIKFNGEGYSCETLTVKAPSYHTIEDIRADAELVAVCKNPQGKTVQVSTLLRTNSGSSRMSTFLNGFIP